MAEFKNNGKLKLLIIVGTRPEIIRLAAVINKCREYFDCLLAHTGQNYDYNLNGVFFKDLKLKDPDVYMDAVGDDLGATMGNIIDKSYKLMVQTKPDAVLVLGDTNSCLSVIGAKRLHIPIFHMDAYVRELQALGRMNRHKGYLVGRILIRNIHCAKQGNILEISTQRYQRQVFRCNFISVADAALNHHILYISIVLLLNKSLHATDEFLYVGSP